MRPLIFFIVGFLFIIGVLGCKKNSDEGKCYEAKILSITCGGTVLQFDGSEDIGEEWRVSPSDSEVYPNCVLTGNLHEKYGEGTTVYFTFKKVTKLSGGPYCDRGGLPSYMIEIQRFFEERCSN